MKRCTVKETKEERRGCAKEEKKCTENQPLTTVRSMLRVCMSVCVSEGLVGYTWHRGSSGGFG